MKIRALYDHEGKILAAVHLDRAGASTHPHPEPGPGKGQSLGDFTVPPSHAHLPFEEACARLRVKVEGELGED
jgi:hypothetical protein